MTGVGMGWAGHSGSLQGSREEAFSGASHTPDRCPSQSFQKWDWNETPLGTWRICTDQQQFLLNFCGVFWLGFFFFLII